MTRAIDEGLNVEVIYLDFAKAFDLVTKLRLLEKLRAHGVVGQVLKWIADWLSQRRQGVAVKGKKSSWVEVKSGVPQGIILGPILFLIFINNLDKEVVEVLLFILKFADDTKLGKIIEDDSSRDSLQKALVQLCAWATKWGMRFNVDKCHVLHVGPTNPRLDYSMNGEPLAKSEMEKYISVLICSNL